MFSGGHFWLPFLVAIIHTFYLYYLYYRVLKFCELLENIRTEAVCCDWISLNFDEFWFATETRRHQTFDQNRLQCLHKKRHCGSLVSTEIVISNFYIDLYSLDIDC